MLETFFRFTPNAWAAYYQKQPPQDCPRRPLPLLLPALGSFRDSTMVGPSLRRTSLAPDVAVQSILNKTRTALDAAPFADSICHRPALKVTWLPCPRVVKPDCWFVLDSRALDGTAPASLLLLDEGPFLPFSCSLVRRNQDDLTTIDKPPFFRPIPHFLTAPVVSCSQVSHLILSRPEGKICRALFPFPSPLFCTEFEPKTYLPLITRLLDPVLLCLVAFAIFPLTTEREASQSWTRVPKDASFPFSLVEL